MSRRVTRRGQGGFTLAETIIAVTILGMIGAMVFGTFAHAMDARDRAAAITEHYHQVRQAMLRMSREIQQAFVSEHKDCDDPRTATLFRAESASNGMRIDFNSFSHYKMQADANESDQNELSYWVDRHPDPEEGQDRNMTVLLRREDGRIDEEPDEGGVVQVLAEKVNNLEFEFYNAKEDRWEKEWDTEDADYKGRLPAFVKITMKVEGPDGTEEEFVTKTRVFLQRPIQITGTGFAKCIE